MSKKQTLVNNGLPEGLHFKDLQEGDVVLVKWRDAAPSHHVISTSYDDHRQRTYKGHVSFEVVGPSPTVSGDQILRKVGSIRSMLESMDKNLSDEDRAVRAE